MRKVGSVKWFDRDRGFGFIEMQGCLDIFVHYSEVRQPGFKDLQNGQTVSFDLVQGMRGPQAENVIVVP